MINAGKYNRKINIYQIVEEVDSDGFKSNTRFDLLTCYASVKTTRGYTLIVNNSDFEKAYTNFTITYTIEYLNNIDNANVELEIQAKEITH